VCGELKQVKYMRAYVEEAGGTSLCALASGAGCTEKETAFIAKMTKLIASGAKDPVEEQTRLETMSSGGKMKPDLMAWLDQRIAILKQFNAAAGGDAAKEEL